jgi:hypothetical protein
MIVGGLQRGDIALAHGPGILQVGASAIKEVETD